MEDVVITFGIKADASEISWAIDDRDAEGPYEDGPGICKRLRVSMQNNDGVSAM